MDHFSLWRLGGPALNAIIRERWHNGHEAEIKARWFNGHFVDVRRRGHFDAPEAEVACVKIKDEQ